MKSISLLKHLWAHSRMSFRLRWIRHSTVYGRNNIESRDHRLTGNQVSPSLTRAQELTSTTWCLRYRYRSRKPGCTGSHFNLERILSSRAHSQASYRGNQVYSMVRPAQSRTSEPLSHGPMITRLAIARFGPFSECKHKLSLASQTKRIYIATS